MVAWTSRRGGERQRFEIPARLEQHGLGLAVARQRDERGAEQALRRSDAPVVFRKDAPAIRDQLRRQEPDPQALPKQRLGGLRARPRARWTDARLIV